MVAPLLKTLIAPFGTALLFGGGVALICEVANLDLSEQWAFITSLCLLIGGVLMSVVAGFTKHLLQMVLASIAPPCIILGAIALTMNRLGMQTDEMDDWVMYLTIAITVLGFLLILASRLIPSPGGKMLKKLAKAKGAPE